MMTMRLAGVLAAVGSFMWVVPSHAVPNVDRIGGAETRVHLRDAQGGLYQVDVVARISQAGTRTGSGSLAVTTRRCAGATCVTVQKDRIAVDSRQVTVALDGTAARLQTSLFGRRLDLVWSEPGPETTADGKVQLYQPVLPEGQVRAWARESRASKVTVTILGLRCAGRDGVVYRETLVDGVQEPAAATLPQKLPPALRRLGTASCG